MPNLDPGHPACTDWPPSHPQVWQGQVNSGCVCVCVYIYNTPTSYPTQIQPTKLAERAPPHFTT